MKQVLETLKLPKDAFDWLMMLYESAQTFDDYADGDEVTRENLDALIWNTLISMPMNSFYIANANALCPIIATTILKWQASDTAERTGSQSAMSYAWRAGFYDIILLVYALCFGHVIAAKDAHYIMMLYGEKFEDYMQEGNKCQIQSQE